MEDFALFRTLSSEQRLKVFGAMVRQDLMRGQMLVAQGEPSDSLFMVLHGALAVRRKRPISGSSQRDSADATAMPAESSRSAPSTTT